MQERWKGLAFLFLMTAFVSAIFGMGGSLFGIGSMAANIARHLFPVFMGLFLGAVFIGVIWRPKPAKP